MGSSISVSSNQVQQDSLFQLTQTNSNTCQAFTNNSLKNLNIAISASNIPQGITISQTAETTADCYISSNLDSISQQVLDNIQNNTASAEKAGFLGLGIGIQVTSSTTKQDISTAIEQSITNLCSAESNNLIENVNITISQSEVGQIQVVQSGSAHSQCVINNLAAINAQAQAQSESTTTAGGSKGLIATVVTIIIIIAIITLVVGFTGKALKKKPSTTAATTQCIEYPCDNLSGQAYIDCSTRTPFDANVYCAPKAATAGPPAAPTTSG
jgi:Fe-S cluster assembly iron-binding protein IscA